MTVTDDLTLSLLLGQLDSQPDDRTLLLVIADRYDELDGSGAGWRALYACELCVHWWDGSKEWGWVSVLQEPMLWSVGCRLPDDWFELLHDDGKIGKTWGACGTGIEGAARANREAATAFLRLASDRQLELLEGRL